MEDYWNLFWATGMPEAWTLAKQPPAARPQERLLYPGPGAMLQPPEPPEKERPQPGDGPVYAPEKGDPDSLRAAGGLAPAGVYGPAPRSKMGQGLE